MRKNNEIFRYFCAWLIIPTVLIAGCRAATSTTDVTWKTFSNQECQYRLQYPKDVQVEVMDKHAMQVKVHTETQAPFQLTCARDYSPGDTLYYFDTEAIGEREIGEYLWSEFRLADGYCDASGCSLPIYALRMAADEVLYTVTFYSQDMTTELQDEILSTLQIASQP